METEILALVGIITLGIGFILKIGTHASGR